MVIRKPFHQAGNGPKSFQERNRFFTAARHNHVGQLRTILGEEPGAVTWRNADKTALMVASEHGQLMSVRTLLDHRADPNARQGMQGVNALHLAAQNNHAGVAALLLHFGARVDTPRDGGITALMDAAHHGHMKTIEILLHQGASVKRMDALGAGALHLAAARDRAEATERLIKAGADINAVTTGGATPLMLAASGGSLASARVLLAARADHHQVDALGRSALDHARETDKGGDGFAAAFKALIDARNAEDAPGIAQPFVDGSENEVRVSRPLTFRRKHQRRDPFRK